MIIEDYPELQEHLLSSPNIMNNAHFKSGLAKIMSKDFLNLTEMERTVTSFLMISSVTGVKERGSTREGYFEYKNAKMVREKQDQFMDCSFLVATSNTVERLFSACKYILIDQKICLAYHLRCLMF